MHAYKSKPSAVQPAAGMNAGLNDAEGSEQAPLDSTQQNGSTQAQAKPAFRMPDPPKKRPMPPPAPRFSAPAKQTIVSGLNQPSATQNDPTAVPLQTQPGPVGAPESSPALCPDGERQNICQAQESKSAKDLVYPATKIGCASYTPST